MSKDTKRLNWLAEQAKKYRTGLVNTVAPDAKPGWLWRIDDPQRFSGPVKKSLRKAIDAAMKEKP